MSTDTDTLKRWRSMPGEDRLKSVGDFLLDIQGVIDPIEIVCEQLETLTPQTNIRNKGRVVLRFNEKSEAQAAYRNLRLLLQDGETIHLHPVEDFNTGVTWYELSMPPPLVQKIRAAINDVDMKASAIATTLTDGARETAIDLRDSLRKDLRARGLFAAIDDVAMDKIVEAFYALPLMHEQVVDHPRASRDLLIPTVEHLLEQAQGGHFAPSNAYEEAFISTLCNAAQSVFSQRHGVGRGTDKGSIEHFFPDDFTHLLHSTLEKRLSHVKVMAHAPEHAGLPQSAAIGKRYHLGSVKLFAPSVVTKQ